MSNIETGTTKVSLTTIVNIANALSVSVDDLLCDNVIHAKPQFENDIKLLLDDCDDYEIRIVKDLLSTIIYTLRRDLSLKNIDMHRMILPSENNHHNHFLKIAYNNLVTDRKNRLCYFVFNRFLATITILLFSFW